MAKTQKSYRLGQRQPRYTTKLNAFSNGMYLTNQIIPEGYAKAMVNYDIDDTGSCIRPRRGREIVQVLNYNTEVLGPVSLTDYLYAYNKANTEVEDIKDIVMSYGLYTKLSDLTNANNAAYKKPIFVSYMDRTVDTNVYYLDENGNYQVQEAGEIYNAPLKEFWALYYDKFLERFYNITNKDIGYVTARTIENAYAFDKPFVGPVGRPIGTVMNNELITFAGAKLMYKEFTANAERNELVNFNNPTLAKLLLTNEGTNNVTIKRKTMSARQLTPIEASATGYNILSETPYTFNDSRGGALSILGILMYDINDHASPVFTARLGQAVSLRIYYQYPTAGDTIKYKIETMDMTNSSSSWEVLENFTHSITAGSAFYYNITSKTERFLVRVTIRNGDDSTTDYPYFREITCGDSSYDNLENKTFDLSTCKGMISWQGCVGVYGVDNAPDTIFFSDVEDPGYFPFPNNIISFDNEILSVHNYLDHLIVVTVDSIWLVAAGTTIATSIQKRILANLHIPEIDAVNLIVLKDQIFFKTDTQFYVLKPNQYTSDSTDLKNYINSTAIANYTNNFTTETVRLLNKVYPLIWQRLTRERRKQIRFEDFSVLDTRSIIRNEEVHYIYTIVPKLTDDIVLDNLNLHLVYNTLTRSWRIYFVAIGDDSVYYAPVLYRNKQSGAYYEFFPHTKTPTTSSLAVVRQTYNTVTDDIVIGNWHLTEEYNNYPYLDTGNIAIEDAFTKRYREVQFNILNQTKTMLRFYTDFICDGVEQVHATRYIINHITDVNDPEYGTIYVTPTEYTNLDIPGLTTLANDETEDDYWAVDIAKFPDLNVATIRLQLQGRGRRGSVQLLNTSLQRYELSDLNWVYRTMSAR